MASLLVDGMLLFFQSSIDIPVMMISKIKIFKGHVLVIAFGSTKFEYEFYFSMWKS
jgi:hypothetical protein